MVLTRLQKAICCMRGLPLFAVEDVSNTAGHRAWLHGQQSVPMMIDGTGSTVILFGVLRGILRT